MTTSLGAPCSGSGFGGDWQPLGPTNMPAQVTGYNNAIWAGAYATMLRPAAI